MSGWGREIFIYVEDRETSGLEGGGVNAGCGARGSCIGGNTASFFGACIWCGGRWRHVSVGGVEAVLAVWEAGEDEVLEEVVHGCRRLRKVGLAGYVEGALGVGRLDSVVNLVMRYIRFLVVQGYKWREKRIRQNEQQQHSLF